MKNLRILLKNYKFKSYVLSLGILFIYGWVFLRSYLVSAVLAILLSIKLKSTFYRILTKNFEMKKREMLKDFLDILDTSIVSGANFYQSIKMSKLELLSMYDDNALILLSVSELVKDIENGISQVEALNNFKDNYRNKEASIFVDTLAISIDSGISINKVICGSRESIASLIEMELDISASLKNANRELIIMSIIPLAIVILMQGTMANKLTFIDYILRGITYLALISSFYMGEKIINVEE